MDRTNRAELTNLCMVYDGNRILVEEKIDEDEIGIFFPGGHIEPKESCTAAVIREIYEETGLTIKNPQLCGVKDWIQEDGSRYIVLLYKTNQFSGELRSSREGRVFWIEIEELEHMHTIWNMKEIVQILTTDTYGEYFIVNENDEWNGTLL